MSTDRYTSPLSGAICQQGNAVHFSQDMKFTTWRKLWIALAETEMELDFPRMASLSSHRSRSMNSRLMSMTSIMMWQKEREKQVRHDVMCHVYAYGQQCPKAKGIIHLGATSCYVGDNTDIIVMHEALKLVHKKLVNVIAELAALQINIRTFLHLAFTHFQPAQPTTSR